MNNDLFEQARRNYTGNTRVPSLAEHERWEEAMSEDGDVYTSSMYGGAPDECSQHWPQKPHECGCEFQSFEQFVTYVNRSKPDEQRLGQWAYNVLARARPDIAKWVHGRYSTDPFYDDTKLQAFYQTVRLLWKDEA